MANCLFTWFCSTVAVTNLLLVYTSLSMHFSKIVLAGVKVAAWGLSALHLWGLGVV